MDAGRESEATPTENRTVVERKSERELVVTRTVDAPARLVFEAWTKPELFRRWDHYRLLRPSTFSICFSSSTTSSNASKRAAQSCW